MVQTCSALSALKFRQCKATSCSSISDAACFVISCAVRSTAASTMTGCRRSRAHHSVVPHRVWRNGKWTAGVDVCAVVDGAHTTRVRDDGGIDDENVLQRQSLPCVRISCGYSHASYSMLHDRLVIMHAETRLVNATHRHGEERHETATQLGRQGRAALLDLKVPADLHTAREG